MKCQERSRMRVQNVLRLAQGGGHSAVGMRNTVQNMHHSLDWKILSLNDNRKKEDNRQIP